MRLVVAAVGRLGRGPERDIAERYRERAARDGRAVGIRAVEVIEIAESRARRAQDRLAEEAARLAAILPRDAVIAALDERGENLSSAMLAKRLRGFRDSRRSATAFLVGGADGLAATLKGRADFRLAFGAMTWPHQLARIMLLEQLYRAVTILSGHPYHRV